MESYSNSPLPRTVKYQLHLIPQADTQSRNYVEAQGGTCLLEFWERALGKICECEKNIQINEDEEIYQKQLRNPQSSVHLLEQPLHMHRH